MNFQLSIERANMIINFLFVGLEYKSALQRHFHAPPRTFRAACWRAGVIKSQ